jgi:hypothetical protein
MPETGTITITARLANETSNYDTFTQTIVESTASVERTSASVAAAKPGTVTTRTDEDTGVLTMTAGHGFVTGDYIDVFWSGGSRRHMAATVTLNAVTIDGGEGDALPATTTVIGAMVPVELAFTVDGEDCYAITVSTPVPGWIVFVDDSDLDIDEGAYQFTTTGGGANVWAFGQGAENPLAGQTTSLVKFSHGDTTAARTMKVAALYGTPP